MCEFYSISQNIYQYLTHLLKVLDANLRYVIRNCQ